MMQAKQVPFFNHPFTPIITYAFFALMQLGLVAIWSPPALIHILVLFIGGLLCWTLVEYLFHRFIFHLSATREPYKSILDVLHLKHHAHPNKVEYVTAHALYSIPIYLFFLGIFWMISGRWAHALLLSAGLSVGYAIYEWTHYAAHHVQPKTAWGLFLKKYHLMHHYRDSDNYFGVTSTFWDIIFRTKPAPDPARLTRILPIAAIKTQSSATL